MNAPSKSRPLEPILASVCVGISDLKKNPAAVVAAAREQQVAVLNRNKPVAYMVSPEIWEYLSGLVEDARLADEATASLAEEGENVSLDDL